MPRDINTVKEFKETIKKAKIVLCTVRFGNVEKSSKISKIEALALVEDLDNDTTGEDLDMYGGSLGHFYDNGEFYIG